MLAFSRNVQNQSKNDQIKQRITELNSILRKIQKESLTPELSYSEHAHVAQLRKSFSGELSFLKQELTKSKSKASPKQNMKEIGLSEPKESRSFGNEYGMANSSKMLKTLRRPRANSSQAKMPNTTKKGETLESFDGTPSTHNKTRPVFVEKIQRKHKGEADLFGNGTKRPFLTEFKEKRAF